VKIEWGEQAVEGVEDFEEEQAVEEVEWLQDFEEEQESAHLEQTEERSWEEEEKSVWSVQTWYLHLSGMLE
jgi:hypothetical protein